MVTPAQIREHYDSLSLIYRTFWGDHIHHGFFTDGESPEVAQIKLLDHCASLLNLRGGESVLDAGCGHGGTLLYLAQQFGCSGTGLTLSPKQAAIAQETARKTGQDRVLQFFVQDVDSLLFPSARFDLVWAMESTEHFAAKARFLQNVSATLRPCGKLLLTAWTGSMENARVREVARAFLCPELWTSDQYCRAAEPAGLQVQCCEDLTPQVIRTWKICRDRVRFARAAVALLPRAARDFVEGIDIIMDAYQTGSLTYSAMVFAHPSPNP
jgi:tocopherol O-methyltransferase